MLEYITFYDIPAVFLPPQKNKDSPINEIYS